MDLQSLIRLLKKYRSGRCSADEMKQLDRWYDSFDALAEKISPIPKEKLSMLWENIEKHSRNENTKGKKLTTWYQITGIAASLFIVLAAAWYLSFYGSQNEEQIHVITPGQRCAELRLSDGSVVALDSFAIVKEVDGSLVKNDTLELLDYSALKTVNGSTAYNTLQVPIGGEYSLRLADGSQVWLNSGSSLKFPLCFTDEVREVELHGEAYFHVTKSTIPFIVKTSDINIKVLGTSFNVSAYENDEASIATLVSGSVEVQDNLNHRAYRIVPGNTLFYQKADDRVIIENPDPGIYTSWINGEFKFRNMRLEEIMIKLNRWYNCTVSYNDPVLKELRFSGAAEKDRPIHYLLGMIEAITDVRFEIKGNKIIVMNK